MVYRSINKEEHQDVMRALKFYDFNFSEAQIFRNTIANNNKVYLIKCKNKSKCILRISNPSKSKQHLDLEIQILEYLRQKHFQLTTKIIPNRKKTPITIIDKQYYILQSFLSGEVKSGVSNLTHFNDKKLINFFKASANFTKAVQGFSSSIAADENKSLFYYIKSGPSLIESKIAQIKPTRILQLLNSRLPSLIEFLEKCERQMLQLNYDNLPKQIVHFDLHPGNVNYIRDDVTGIFDFDWVRFDTRITDLACTIGQACYKYRGKNRAKYDQQKILLGLKAYKDAYGKSEFTKDQEPQLIIAGLKAYMFFQLLWILDWHLKNPQDENGYKYIEFSLNVLKLNDFDNLIPKL